MERQRRGFEQRSAWPLSWMKIDCSALPTERVFGESKEWLRTHDVIAFCTHAGEDLLLIHLAWHGFPDPPEWGLWSRTSDDHALPWQPWGYFTSTPESWKVPKLDDWKTSAD